MRGMWSEAHDAVMPDNHERGGVSTAELIALGRDREAVDAARRGSPTTPGGPMDGVQQLDQIIPMLETLVDGIGPDDLECTTPCAGFTVAGVLEHMLGGATAFAPAFRGGPSPDSPPAPDDQAPLQERWHHALRELHDAVHAPGAQERTIASPFGEVPGSTFARYVAFDGLIHGYDLAAATAQPYSPPDDLVAEIDGFARQLLQPEMRDGDTFAAETEAPAGATPLERLVAFSGRTLPDATTEASR